jgi:hypothetical protein
MTPEPAITSWDTSTGTAEAAHEATLTDLVGEYYSDPLGFVLMCFPWGRLLADLPFQLGDR